MPACEGNKKLSLVQGTWICQPADPRPGQTMWVNNVLGMDNKFSLAVPFEEDKKKCFVNRDRFDEISHVLSPALLSFGCLKAEKATLWPNTLLSISLPHLWVLKRVWMYILQLKVQRVSCTDYTSIINVQPICTMCTAVVVVVVEGEARTAPALLSIWVRSRLCSWSRHGPCSRHGRSILHAQLTRPGCKQRIQI